MALLFAHKNNKTGHALIKKQKKMQILHRKRRTIQTPSLQVRHEQTAASTNNILQLM